MGSDEGMMETVNFQCGHCGNLMAVGLEFLGQQMLCPHCQQVVLAPAEVVVPAPPASDNLTLEPANPEGAEALQPVSFETPPAPLVSIVEATAVSPLNGPVPQEPAAFVTAPEPSPLAEPAPLVDAAPAAARRPRDYSGRVNWFIPLVFIPLVLYAVLCTAIAGYLYLKLRTQPASPFDSFPDWEGDVPGVRKEKPKLSYDRKFTTLPLPPHLLVGLGQTIRVGDLQVTPTRVERRKVELVSEEGRPEPSPTDGLVLHLRLKNLAEDYAFTPLDNYFDRRWKPGNDGVPPLTLLQAGPETFHGGPARWQPLGRGRKEKREWLAGRKNVDREGLAPGQEQEVLLATDAWDPAVARHLFGLDEEGNVVAPPYTGKLLWRVQLRRGLVEWKGRRLPATAVVGVEFTDADYAGKPG